MNRSYTLTRWVLAIFLGAVIISGCSKSQAEPESESDNTILNYPLISPDSSRVGSISISQIAGGEARIVVQLEKPVLSQYRPPFQPLLMDSLPLAVLTPIDPSTGISETAPVRAANKNFTLGYGALLFNRNLKLLVEDADKKLITLTQIR
ncbi:MAG TPA: hypothetical protein VF145_09465 [Chitinophagaceae bacterium]